MEASNRGQNHPNKYLPKGFLNRMKFKRKILRIIIIKIIIINNNNNNNNNSN